MEVADLLLESGAQPGSELERQLIRDSNCANEVFSPPVPGQIIAQRWATSRSGHGQILGLLLESLPNINAIEGRG